MVDLIIEYQKHFAGESSKWIPPVVLAFVASRIYVGEIFKCIKEIIKSFSITIPGVSLASFLNVIKYLNEFGKKKCYGNTDDDMDELCNYNRFNVTDCVFFHPKENYYHQITMKQQPAIIPLSMTPANSSSLSFLGTKRVASTQLVQSVKPTVKSVASNYGPDEDDDNVTAAIEGEGNG